MSVTVSVCNTDQIRAAMGLTEREVSDKQLTDLQLEIQLSIFLSTVFPDFDAVVAAVLAGTADADQTRQYQILQCLAMYQGALIACVAFQTLTAQQVSDGGTTLLRFAPDDITTTMSNIAGQRDKFWGLIDPEFFTNSAPVLFSVSKPGYDPVTNCGSPKPPTNYLYGVSGPYGYLLWNSLF